MRNSVNTTNLATVWIPIGVAWGFVVLAAWSLGPFFAWTALLVSLAGIAHLFAIESRWRTLLIPLWLLVGPSGLCALFFAFHWTTVAMFGGQLVESSWIVKGTWLFLFLLGLMGAGAALRRGQRLRGSLHEHGR